MNNKYGKIPADSGLVRLRNMGMSRRQFGKAILGSAVAGMTIGLPLRASAATGISSYGVARIRRRCQSRRIFRKQ